jgi:hypothetical protein
MRRDAQVAKAEEPKHANGMKTARVGQEAGRQRNKAQVQARASEEWMKAHPRPAKPKITSEDAIRQVRAKLYAATRDGHQPFRASPMREIPTPTAQTSKRVANAPRQARTTHAGAPAKDDRSKKKALAVLAREGVTPNDRRIADIGSHWRVIENRMSDLKKLAQPKLSAARRAALHRDYRAMGRALENARLTTAEGKRLRACFFLPEPAREPEGKTQPAREPAPDHVLGPNELPEDLTILARESGPDRSPLRHDLMILDRFVEGLPFGRPSGKSKGRPVSEKIKRTLRAFGIEHGWSWQVCAAALFVSGESGDSYAAIKKSLREWVARNKLIYADIRKDREEWTKRPGIGV